MESIGEQYIKHNGENLWDFEIVDGCDSLNINHIHPLKQRDVSALSRLFVYDSHIRAAIVFGSSVRFDCHSASDLDLLIVRDDDQMRIDVPLDSISGEMDILFASHLGDRLRKEIEQTGVLVYCRDDRTGVSV
ncbi:MAG: nucleotidyltransferase domain-containing protein [Clostridiales bacterium]|nr:nucleotidyltransferase domain-containing protein [Clostridiales bacterium]MCD8134239.1 nucleotidyltransferase domain-containing protein [Clostridiales bacterium]